VTLTSHSLARLTGPRRSDLGRRITTLSIAANSARELHPQAAPGFAAEPLKTGVVVANDLSIAIVRPIAKLATPQKSPSPFAVLVVAGKGMTG